jgi:glycosyltransferase involved in cell wall biosynthesis
MGRILHLISQLEEGGAQRQLSYVVSRAKNHEVEVASLIASPPENLFPYFRDCGVPVHFLSYSSDFYAPEILAALQKLLDDRKFGLVHCWLYQAIVQGGIVSRICGVPCLASPRSMLDRMAWGGNKKWEKWFIRKTMRQADLALFPSFSAAIDYVDSGWVAAERARVVQNGVDCEHFHETHGGDALVAVGRISNEKGLEDLREIVSTS